MPAPAGIGGPGVAGMPPVPPYAAPVPYPHPATAVYPPYPAPPAAAAARPGEPVYYQPQLFYAPIPAPHPPPPGAQGPDGEPVAYAPAPPGYYPATFFYPSQYPGPYMVPHPAHAHPHAHVPRPDMQIPLMAASHYAPYPQVYPRAPSRSPDGGEGAPAVEAPGPVPVPVPVPAK